jgi:hypothetical protein
VSDAPASGTLDDIAERLADGLRADAQRRARAEAQLAAFAFVEGTGDGGRHGVGGASPPDWRYRLARLFGALSAPGVLVLLDAVGSAGSTLEAIAGLPGGPSADRLALADAVADLTAAGLASRELESGLVTLTPLGEACRALVAAIEGHAEAAR